MIEHYEHFEPYTLSHQLRMKSSPRPNATLGRLSAFLLPLPLVLRETRLMRDEATNPRQDAADPEQTAGTSSDAPDSHPLRLQRRLRGWSQGDVAQRLMDLGYELGVNLGVMGATVGRWERGVCAPRPPYPKLLCVLFGSTAELGFGPSPYPRGSGKLDDVMERRRLLGMLAGAAMAPILPRGTARAAAADSQDATVDRLASVLEKLSTADAATASVLESCILDARRLDDALGSRIAVETAVPLRRIIRTVLADGRTDEATRQRLTLAGGNLTQLLASLAFDMNDHATSLRYLEEALAIAHETNASDLGPYVLGWRGKVETAGGRPQQAVAYIDSAKSWAEAKGSPATQAWLAREEADALAQVKDRGGAERALDRAQKALARSKPEDEPPWMYWFSSIDYKFGSVYAVLGLAAQARKSLRQRLETLDPSRTRDRAFIHIRLAETHVLNKEVDEACRLAGEALTLACGTRSDRAVTRVRKLRTRLEPWERQPSVRDLDDQLAATSCWSQAVSA